MRSAKSGFGFGVGMAIGLALTLAVIAVAGYYAIREKGFVTARPDAALDARARSLALAELKRYGIAAISDDAGLVDDGGLKALVGTGRDASGKLKPLMVHFRVATFGNDRQWKIETINIDGTEVYKAR